MWLKPASDFVFLTITYSAGFLVAMLVTLLSALSFVLHKHTKRVASLLISVLGSVGTVWVLKHLFNTPRPLGALYTESSPSFPSAHAAIAMSLYGFLFWVIYKHEKHHLQNKSLILLALLILLIGFSRIYLGVHYVSDVLVGYLIGLLWIWLSFRVTKTRP